MLNEQSQGDAFYSSVKQRALANNVAHKKRKAESPGAYLDHHINYCYPTDLIYRSPTPTKACKVCQAH